MAEFSPTASQREAIELRGSTALISAGAGSGKTKVLTERLMHYILDSEHGVDIDSFLIITFTRAAAEELRGRIMDAVAEALAKDPGNRRLRRQSALCSRAQISTIHSFCQSVLRENAQKAEITPDFKILDDDRATVMKNDALSRVLEAKYSKIESDDDFRQLANTVGVGRDDTRLVKLAITLYDKMQSQARPELWAEEQKSLMRESGIDVASTPWGQELLRDAKRKCDYHVEALRKAIGQMESDAKIKKAYHEPFCDLMEKVAELTRCIALSWDRAKELLPIEAMRLGQARGVDEGLKNAIKKRYDDCKEDLKKLNSVFYSDSDTLMHEMNLVAPAMRALLDLCLDFDKEYTAIKRRAGFLDYADLEHLTARLLTEEDGSASKLARELSARYTEIMVDEYQDVSRVQDAIFSAVSKNGQNLFMVGDIKQSIYRFRLAEPEIFNSKYKSYKDSDRARRGEARRIILRENFRSRKEIIDCANAVFYNCMSPELGDIEYDENAALVHGASYYEGEAPMPEILLLEQPEAEEGEESPSKIEAEARMVALKIKELVERETPILKDGELKSMSYGDVAILMRSPNSISGTYKRILQQHGVPVASAQGSGFYTSIEVSAVMSLLAVIDNPHQDIPLIAVLRSPVFGFTADELSEIRAVDKRVDFYTALLADESEKAKAFLEKLDYLREAAADMAPTELLWTLYNELDILALCSAMSDGESRRGNLLALLEMSEKYMATGFRGLHHFVLWLKRLAEKNNEPATAGTDGNAVQIMSIHRSKGLEFPVVFYCDTARRFNFTDASDTVLVHPTLGLGPKVTDLVRRVEYPTIARNAISQRIRNETRSEEMRLLYVALTRPKERLYITASVRKTADYIEKLKANVTSPMSAEILLNVQRPIDWLLYAALADEEHHLRIRYCLDESTMHPMPESTMSADYDEETLSKLKANLSFSYEHKQSESLPSKVTATELKHYQEADSDAMSIAPVDWRFKMPDFTKKDKALTGTERGIATHLVLQCMDFDKTDSIDAIKAEIARLYEKKFISLREREAVDARSIYTLFSSPLGERMRRADKITREFKFSLLCDAKEIFGTAEGEELLLQGVVDCCIEEGGYLTVIDYKTDSVFGDDIEVRAESYKPQIASYARALERIFNKPVRESVLYFIRAGKAITIRN